MAEPDAVDAIVSQWATERPGLPTTAMEIFGRVYRIARHMGDTMEATYARHGIGRGEFDVLGTLRRSGAPYELSPSRLATTMMLTTGGMTGRLDRLERAGLVERVPDPDDRRGLRVRLTAKGGEVLDAALLAGVEIQEAALAGLSDAERRRLTALLRTLLTAVQP